MSAGVPALPIASDPLIAEAKRRTRVRRSVFALLLLAGMAAGLAFALRPSPGPGVARPLVGSVHVGKLSVSVPRGFYVYALRSSPYRAGVGFSVYGHVLTNFRVPANTNIEHVLGHWGVNGPPSNEVALMLRKDFHMGPMGPGGIDNLRLPLNLDQPWIRERFHNEVVGGYRYGDFKFGTDYNVMYWSGSTAPANDRLAILHALRSIRPTR